LWEGFVHGGRAFHLTMRKIPQSHQS